MSFAYNKKGCSSHMGMGMFNVSVIFVVLSLSLFSVMQELDLDVHKGIIVIVYLQYVANEVISSLC